MSGKRAAQAPGKLESAGDDPFAENPHLKYAHQ
jgi:hypothetical protein